MQGLRSADSKGVDAPFDIITVPDFLGPQARIFEARALFFLGSWLENVGRARSFPLHLACIGVPSDRVCRLAERANARITVHDPIPLDPDGFCNGLRGLEVRPETLRFLLLDTDMVFLGDPSPLARLPRCVAAAPEMNAMAAPRVWERIYATHGLPPPAVRIPSLTGELGLPLVRERFPGERTLVNSMVPYFNTGAVLAPWDCDLRKLWEECIAGIQKLAEDAPGWERTHHSDQAGFSLAVAKLRAQGLAFERLDGSCNVLFQQIYARAIEVDEVRLYHAIALFKNLGKDGFTKRSAPRELWRYTRRMWRRGRHLWQLGRAAGYDGSHMRRLLRAGTSAWKVGQRFRTIYERQVQPVMGDSAVLPSVSG